MWYYKEYCKNCFLGVRISLKQSYGNNSRSVRSRPYFEVQSWGWSDIEKCLLVNVSEWSSGLAYSGKNFTFEQCCPYIKGDAVGWLVYVQIKVWQELISILISRLWYYIISAYSLLSWEVRSNRYHTIRIHHLAKLLTMSNNTLDYTRARQSQLWLFQKFRFVWWLWKGDSYWIPFIENSKIQLVMWD